MRDELILRSVEHYEDWEYSLVFWQWEYSLVYINLFTFCSSKKSKNILFAQFNLQQGLLVFVGKRILFFFSFPSSLNMWEGEFKVTSINIKIKGFSFLNVQIRNLFGKLLIIVVQTFDCW